MIKPLPNDFRWSFSKLEQYETCPWSFALQNMHDPPLPRQSNAWAEYGTLCHKIMEDYALGKLKVGQLTAEFEKNYESYVVHRYPPYPKGYEEKSYEQAVAYFDAFTGFGDQYEFVEAEHKFVISVGPYKLAGIADLILKEKSTDEYIVSDYKTKSPTSMKKDVDSYTRQLYLYAQYVKERYGKYPKQMRFDMIKTRDFITLDFDPNKMDEVMRWTENMIDTILLDDEFQAKPDKFFCRYICDVFNYCGEGMACCGNCNG